MKMKRLKALLAANPNLLVQAGKKKDKEVRHLIFSSNDPEDKITIPLCGQSDTGILKHKLKGVTCLECKVRALELAGLDSYEDAVVYMDSITPNLVQPDESIMLERHDQQPTKLAQRHMKNKEFLRSKEITLAADLHLNIIGSKEETYYWNMVELDLVDEGGEALESIWE